MSNHDWPELEDAKRRKEEKRKEELRALKAELYIDRLEEKLPYFLERRRIADLISPHKEQIKSLIIDWHNSVYEHLYRCCQALWGDAKTTKWKINCVIGSASSRNGISLFWEAHKTAWYYSGWITVELCLNDRFQPIEFQVECGNPANYLTSPPTLEDLKTLLVEAFESEATRDLHRKEKAGVPFKILLDK